MHSGSFCLRLDDRWSRALRRSYQLGFLGDMPIADQVDHALGFAVILEEELGGAPNSVIDLGTGAVCQAWCWRAAGRPAGWC